MCFRTQMVAMTGSILIVIIVVGIDIMRLRSTNRIATQLIEIGERL